MSAAQDNRGLSNPEADAQALQEEVRQLKRTLEIRRSEIALTSKRVQDLEDLATAMRETSLVCDERTRSLNTLEASLHSEVERGVLLQRELVHLQETIAEEDAERTKVRSGQLRYMSQLLKLTDEMMRISHEAASSEPLPPKKTLKGLQSLADEIVLAFEDSAKHLSNSRQLYDKEVDKLQRQHEECVSTIQAAADENIRQREALEAAWKLEEQGLSKELHAVRQRAKEAAFHHHRGSGVKYDAKFEERRSIAERRVLHQECVELQSEIDRVERERERDKIANARARAALLAK